MPNYKTHGRYLSVMGIEIPLGEEDKILTLWDNVLGSTAADAMMREQSIAMVVAAGYEFKPYMFLFDVGASSSGGTTVTFWQGDAENGIDAQFETFDTPGITEQMAAFAGTEFSKYAAGKFVTIVPSSNKLRMARIIGIERKI